MRISCRGLGAALMIVVTLTGQAFAHAHLATAVPPAGSKLVQAPGELELHFSEPIDLKFSGVTITGPTPVSLGAPALKAGDAATLLVPITSQMPAGTYTVSWRALSSDGHTSKGSYTLTLAP